MSRTRNYMRDTLDIQRRFFDTLEELNRQGRIPGKIAGFCGAYGIDRRHWYAQRKNPYRGYFETAWIVPLVRHFRISAEWLLTGRGEKYVCTRNVQGTYKECAGNVQGTYREGKK